MTRPETRQRKAALRPITLRLLPREEYRGVNHDDPIRFYFVPVLGRMYRKRVELCLGECTGGQRVLEVGFGSGLTFLHLHEMYEEVHGLDLTADAKQVTALWNRHNIPTQLRNGDVLEMPYPDEFFDTVLLISILEHLKPPQLSRAFAEIRRVLKRGGQVVYGVPVERRLMVVMFAALGYDIRRHHFSTERDVAAAAGEALQPVQRHRMNATPSILGAVYEVGHFVKDA